MKRMGLRSVWILLVICASGMGGSTAVAQEDADEVYQLGEVVISGRRDAGVETISTVRTISAAELEVRGVKTLDEAIRLVPGLQVRIGGAGTPRVDIRGFRTRHVQLLLDGIPINDTYDGQFDPTTIPVEQIARIKITTGGGSVLYGPGGNGGVINIITTRSGGLEGFHGSVGAEAGEESAYRGALTLSGTTRKWKIFASGDTYKADGYPLSGDFAATGEEDGERRENSDIERQSFFASARYAHSPRTLLGLTFNRIQGENGVPPLTNYDKNDPFTQKARYDRVDDLSGYGVQAAFDHAANRDLTLRGWTYLNRLETDENRYDDDTYATQAANGARGSSTSTQIAGASLQVRRRMGSIGLATLGLIAENDGWEASGFKIGKNDKITTTDDDRDVRVYSAALQYETWPVEGLGIALGGAYHAQDREEESGSDFSFLLGASYHLSERTQVKGSWARKVRFPSIRQLYDADAGNPGLGAETTWHYEAGIQRRIGSSALISVTAFLIDAGDFIEKIGDDPYMNFEEYRFSGFEVGAEKSFAADLSLRGTYSYLDSEDRSAGSEREELQHRPRHKLGLEGTYRSEFGLTPHVSVMRVAGQYFYSRETPLQKKALNDYTLVDVKLKQVLLEDRVEVHVKVDNLLDEDYEQSYGLPQAGRTLYGGFKVPF